MSFAGIKPIIEENDDVIVYVNPHRIYRVSVKRKVQNKAGVTVDNIVQTIFGHLNVAQLIGKEYGIKLKLAKGWVCLLQPTPDLWLSCLPHRTQIIYGSDISMILFRLNVKPGSVVVESGTGSGALSHAFIRAIQPTGFLYTFDFHEFRVQKATEEFKQHGLSQWVSVQQKDACVDGFGLERIANVVFLDIPKPWDAIQHVIKILKEDGRFCSFSPCVEQVQKTCASLVENGFKNISTHEIVQIERQVVTYQDDEIDLRYLKKAKSKDASEESAFAVAATPVDQSNVFKSFLSTTAGDDEDLSIAPQRLTSYQTSQKGHTGYLTFATFEGNI